MRYLLLSFLTIASYTCFAQSCLDINEAIPGYFYAGSNLGDSTYSNGFYESPNYPKPLAAINQDVEGADSLRLIALPDSVATFRAGISGFKVFLINQTDRSISIDAEDSRLDIIRQVYYKGQWRNIEYLPHSWCGNSYHKMILDAGKFWDFTAPCIVGKIPAKSRFVLLRYQQTPLISNTFNGSFNRGQIAKKGKTNP